MTLETPQPWNDMRIRPWPVPESPWAMRMRWTDLLFAHWIVDAPMLQRLLPEGLELDVFDGKAYVSVVPFKMEGVSLRGVPNLPGLHAFPELNLRTYVRCENKPGVWFFSLDAGQKLAVRVARHFFHLPYFDARFKITVQTDFETSYSSVRTHRGAPPARFRAVYRPTGPAFAATAGTLAHWLTERYCLYSAQDDRLFRGEINHVVWPLQPASLELYENTLGKSFGIALSENPVMTHYVKSLDVNAWLVSSVGR